MTIRMKVIQRREAPEPDYRPDSRSNPATLSDLLLGGGEFTGAGQSLSNRVATDGFGFSLALPLQDCLRLCGYASVEAYRE